jgi:hypothetical protein
MNADDVILERWIAETVASYPSAVRPFLAGKEDPFRNPVGHTLRRTLATLLEQVQGAMDEARIAGALDDLIRIRAVQDLTPSQAVKFVFLLKPILRQAASEQNQLLLAERIDQLALMAFDKYMQCREHLAQIRLNERRRSLGMHPAVD